MKTLLLILLALPVYLLAQEPITIDLKTSKIKGTKVALDKVEINFGNCPEIKDNDLTLEIFYQTDREPQSFKCTGGIKLDLKKIINADPQQDFILTVRGDKNTNPATKLEIKFTITKDGNVLEKVDQPEGQQEKSIDASKIDFVDKSFFIPVYKEPDICCRYPRIIYDPCCNRYEIYDHNEEKTHYLKYRPKISKNHGVVFIIKDFNTLKYDISVTKEFTNSNVEIPELFGSVSGVLSSKLAGLKNNAPQSEIEKITELLRDQLSKIIKLNSDLTSYLKLKMSDLDCSSLKDFEDQKKSIIQKVKTEFNIPFSDPKLQFEKQYNEAKESYIAEAKKKDPTYTAEKFNEAIKKLFGLPKSADEIVTETQGLLSILSTTKFEYQYNVAQLENADKIVFSLNIKPKEGSNGSIHMTNEPISIPIRYGWKMDFTTGFYYSSLRHEEFALRRKVPSPGDTVQEIISQNKKGTIGVAALMHIYPRLGSTSISGTFGVGAAPDLNYSFLLGFSVLFGRENRFAISGGFNFSSIKVLSGQYYDAAGVKIDVPKTATSVDTYSKLSRGGYISLTYSFGLSKQKQVASAGDDAKEQKGSEEGDEEKEKGEEEKKDKKGKE